MPTALLRVTLGWLLNTPLKRAVCTGPGGAPAEGLQLAEVFHIVFVAPVQEKVPSAGVGVGVKVGVGVAVAIAVAVAVGVGVNVAVGLGLAVGVGVGVGTSQSTKRGALVYKTVEGAIEQTGIIGLRRGIEPYENGAHGGLRWISLAGNDNVATQP